MCIRDRRYTLPFGVRLPLTKGAAGKALIQHLDADALSQVLRSAIAVSYTHLDVYKRQPGSRARPGRRGSPPA